MAAMRDSSFLTRNHSSIASRHRVCLRELELGTHVVAGNAGDHHGVLELLVRAYQSQLAEDFQSRLDEPSYEPSDRLLVEREGELIGHVRVSKQIGWFYHQRFQMAKLQDFVLLPEYQAAQYDEALLEVAESVAAQEGSVLALVQTERPEWFRQHGWSGCRGQGFTQANTRAVLSHFDAPMAGRRRRRGSIEIRSWRHFELDRIQPIYGQVCINMWGALQRSEAAWQWLVGRKAHDQILIAVNKPKSEARVVGYAVVRDSCLVEMLTLPGYENVRTRLIARACRDAIDRDHHFVSLHTPATDPMHELMITAGGNWINDAAAMDGKWMFKLLAPSRWIERLYPILHERAGEAGIARPLGIDFIVGDAPQRFTFTRRSSRLGKLGRGLPRPQVRCDRHTFQEMLTSNLTFSAALERGKLQVDHDEVLSTLAALFPPKLFWQSPFEMLRL